MCDKLVFDLSQEIEGSPNVFVRKDWINILDNQNQNYNNNQSVIDTSQLSNSNKYMSYREAYFSIPFVVTLATTGFATSQNITGGQGDFDPLTSVTSADYALGLKNWFGQIIHSFTLDYNGTTIVQQTPYVNMWNSFKLMTSLSLNDIYTQGATIGFYPDDAISWQYSPPVAGLPTRNGQGVCNNTDYDAVTPVSGLFNNFKSGGGNEGFLSRQQLINFDIAGRTDSSNIGGGNVNCYGNLLQGGGAGVLGAGGESALKAVWKNYIYNKVTQTSTATAPGAQTVAGTIQYAVVATVYLKHVHSFFNMCPLLKGVFMKMTMNLNNTTTTLIATSSTAAAGAVAPIGISCTAVSNPLGGVNPLMIASTAVNNGAVSLYPSGILGAAGSIDITYKMNISVGATCLDSSITGIQSAPLSKSIYLYIPAYIFNPTFESAYLSSPVKQIKYTDIYQYQVLGVSSGNNFNNLLTNGIANVKSVLILPFYSTSAITTTATVTPGNGSIATVACNTNTGFLSGTPVWQSPYDPAGTGPTSPMCWISNFNVQVSGQNAIYNLEKYNFEQFNNQLYGQNAVNGGLTDGITSGLIDRQRFDMEYCYYYVNIERMLPVEMSVPKSIQILGQNYSSKALDLICFIEYGCEIAIDALTGARV